MKGAVVSTVLCAWCWHLNGWGHSSCSSHTEPPGRVCYGKTRAMGLRRCGLVADSIPSLSGRRRHSSGSPWLSRALGTQACVSVWLCDLLERGTCPCLSPLVHGGSYSTWRVVVVTLGVLEASIVGGLTWQ